MQGDNLFQLLGPRYAPDAATYMLLAALVMIPTVWLPDLKALSGLGVVGVAATLTVTAAIAYTLISGIFAGPCRNSAYNACCLCFDGRSVLLRDVAKLLWHEKYLPLQCSACS